MYKTPATPLGKPDREEQGRHDPTICCPESAISTLIVSKIFICVTLKKAVFKCSELGVLGCIDDMAILDYLIGLKYYSVVT